MGMRLLLLVIFKETHSTLQKEVFSNAVAKPFGQSIRIVNNLLEGDKNENQIKTLLVFFFLLSINFSAQQKEDYSKYPGYFNYKEIWDLKKPNHYRKFILEETY